MDQNFAGSQRVFYFPLRLRESQDESAFTFPLTRTACDLSREGRGKERSVSYGIRRCACRVKTRPTSIMGWPMVAACAIGTSYILVGRNLFRLCKDVGLKPDLRKAH
jgi:hypothetical protein